VLPCASFALGVDTRASGFPLGGATTGGSSDAHAATSAIVAPAISATRGRRPLIRTHRALWRAPGSSRRWTVVARNPAFFLPRARIKVFVGPLSVLVACFQLL